MSLLRECELRITKAKTAMILDHPFYATVVLSLLFKNAALAGMPSVKTMATDGRCIYWDEEFTAKLTFLELVGVLVHETLHVVFMHMLRRGSRNPLLWNIACDYVINILITDAGLKLPKGGYLDPMFRNWTAERVYDFLTMNPPPGFGEGLEQGWGGFMHPRNDDGTPMSESQVSELAEEIKIKVKQAAESAKSVGKLPGGLEGLIEAVGKPTVNWKDYIQNWVAGKVPDDFSWKRANRKWLVNHGIYMPRMELHGAGNGVLSIDNSGSVSDGELRDYVREIVGVIEICNPDKLTIIQHDSVVQKVDEWESGDDFSGLKIKGRGGTRIRPVFDLVANMDEQVDWMICFTDMGICDWPQAHEAPDFPVLWAATGPDQAKFGTYLPLRPALEQV